MRIQQLDLLAYGKFTQRRLDFPAAARDFHVVVGANEAGKSTTRSAILDLLYGIETRSAFDFVHIKADLRLGATLTHGGESLAFVRHKARNRTLFDPQGQPLAESALAVWLGGADRDFFDQMFGLDQSRLAAGGQSILSAKNDIGQILFQSAAGIGSLGTVRDQLAAEADALWAPRKSAGRAYYVAADALAAAEARLKAATVRTRDWVEADARVRQLEDQRSQLRASLHALESQRLTLERVRRVLAPLRQWHGQQAALQALGDVPLLPPDAGRQLAEAELALAAAGREQQLHAGQAAQRAAQLAALPADTGLLRFGAEIDALAERRQQLRQHDRDILRAQAELAGHWQQVQTALRQLGWSAAPDGIANALSNAPAEAPANATANANANANANAPAPAPADTPAHSPPSASAEIALAHRLPPLPARAALLGCARRFERLDQARQSADTALRERQADAATLQAQLAAGAAAGTVNLPAALRVALAQARALGDAQAGPARDAVQLARCQRALASAQAGLDRWLPASDPLHTEPLLRLPTPADVAGRQQAWVDSRTACQRLSDKQRDLATDAAAATLAINQYRQAHHPVSADDLAQARTRRDAAWQRIVTGVATLPAAAPGFEQQMAAADQLADQRHDKAREASELQSRLDAQARLQQQSTDTDQRLADQQSRLAALEADWAALAAGLGLPGLPLTEVEPWRAARAQRLQAESDLRDAQQALAASQQAVADVAAQLATALAGAGVAVEPDARFETLLWIAGDAVDAAVAATTRQATLQDQRDAAALALARQHDLAAVARAEFDDWQRHWQAAAVLAGLPGTVTVAGAESALAVMDGIDVRLRHIQDLRQTHIANLQRELSDFAQDVTTLVAAWGAARGAADWPSPPASAAAPADQVADLVDRLAAARDQHQQAQRLRTELGACQADASRAADRLALAQAALAPLLRQAGVPDAESLRPLIGASDQRRQQEAAAASALQALHEGGDGLSLDALQAEVAATPTDQLPLALAELATRADALRLTQDALTIALTQASAALAQIAGQDDAARAETERQQALAAMANAAERYLTVHTAARLLKWAIDRYRETRQGPMLGRTGEVFAALTLGSFQRLTVDADSDPPALFGQRADGSRVGTAGMSEGTRDQLYLALRLAALELHLGASPANASPANASPANASPAIAGHALPFIADDLFINYDDARALAGLQALARLSELTQVIFLSHHAHLLPLVRSVFGAGVNVVAL